MRPNTKKSRNNKIWRTQITMHYLTRIKNTLKNIKWPDYTNKLKPEISEQQNGFVRNKGTSNAILELRLMSEKCIDLNRPLYICFVESQKAFDRVKHNILLEILQQKKSTKTTWIRYVCLHRTFMLQICFPSAYKNISDALQKKTNQN